MPCSIRPALPHDVPAMVASLTRDAQQRGSLDPLCWRIAADAPIGIERALASVLSGSQASAQELWLVAEHARRIVGIAHAMLVPVPPIYDSSAGSPGLLLDDCYVSAEAPAGTPAALLLATEAALRTAGASRLIASCPAAGPLRPLYERVGYAPVTLYLVKHHLRVHALPSMVRPARAEDVPGIVISSAEHRRILTKINPRFWHIHAEADRRFGAWMHRSLTLADRDMFVVDAAGEVHGYVIAQPISPLLVPAGHEVAAIGLVDDFYDADFANIWALSTSGLSSETLLAAAEGAFARRGVDSALVVCPAAWSSKISVLERRGYETAKLWMLKR